jgi:anti-sigma factor RsiW
MSGLTELADSADLHALVDGFIDRERRANTLRHLAGAPGDRARVEAWQAQNVLLRDTFSTIVREPIPPLLDLIAKPRLQCVAANDSIAANGEREGEAAVLRRSRRLGLAAVVAVLTFGVVVIALILPHQSPRDASEASTAERAIPVDIVGRGSPMPTTTIPDLRPSGFRFSGAEIEAAAPGTITFHYRSEDGERITLQVTAEPDAATDTAADADGSFAWRQGGKSFTLTGSASTERLRQLGTVLRDAFVGP